MPADNALERLQRFLLLVPWLANHRGATIAETAERFGVSAEQIREDLRDICDSETPGLFFDDTVRIVYWRSDDGIDDDCEIFVEQALRFDRPTRIASGMATQLVLGLDVLEQIMGAPNAAIRSARVKLTNLAPKVAPTSVKVHGKGVASESMHVILAALATRSCAEIDYLAGGRDEVTKRVIEPLSLITDAGLTRVRAWCHVAKAVRTFRLDRVLSATASDATPVAPDFVDDGEAFADAASFSVTAKASTSAAWAFDGLPNCSVTEDSATAEVVATFAAGSVEWAVRWALAHSDVVEVLEPERVRAEAHRRARAALTHDRQSGLPPG